MIIYNDLPFYGINPAQAENPLFFLYLFQDLNDVIILEGEDLGAKEVNKRRPEDQKRGSHAATVPGRVGPSQLALVAPFASILRPGKQGADHVRPCKKLKSDGGSSRLATNHAIGRGSLAISAAPIKRLP